MKAKSFKYPLRVVRKKDGSMEWRDDEPKPKKVRKCAHMPFNVVDPTPSVATAPRVELRITSTEQYVALLDAEISRHSAEKTRLLDGLLAFQSKCKHPGRRTEMGVTLCSKCGAVVGVP